MKYYLRPPCDVHPAISDNDKQLVTENRIEFRGHDIALASFPASPDGDLSRYFVGDVIVREASVTLAGPVGAA